MMRQSSQSMLIVLTLLLLQGCNADLSSSTPAPGPGRPNIVLILADDLGYSDIGSYGSEIQTPNLDSLAADGIRFAQFYNAARCVPTRASLLTGHYPHRAGLGHMNYDAGEPGYKGVLSDQTATIAEVLSAGGYRTHMTGKWHLTPKPGPESDSSSWPLQRGFQSFFGTLPGHGSFYSPAGLMKDNNFIEADEGFFYTDEISDDAASFIGEAANSDDPFFLYVAYTAPHYPLHARAETIQKYDGVYDVGWDVLREQRRHRLNELGLTNVEVITPDEGSIPWSDETHQEWQAKRMQAFAAMVDEMDQGIGKILRALEATGIEDDTLVVFLSDNGGSPEGHLYNTIERMEKPWVSSVIPKQTRDGVEVVAGDFPDLAPGPENTYGSYGLRWASVSNTPFRRHKSWVHEGGISTPMILRWPSTVPNGGSVTHEIGHIIDLLPTFLDVAGVEYSDAGNGRRKHELPGRSLQPVLDGSEMPDRSVIWEHEGNRAIRRGNWKLVSEFPGTWAYFYSYAKDSRWELYDMSIDRGEQNDLADVHPELVQDLAREYERLAAESLVVQWDQLSGRIE
jgi:arylsulfatase A-like enzyme